MNHTDACEEARAGHRKWVYDAWGERMQLREPDPFPPMANLSDAQQQAVLDCPHWAHDAVRQFMRGSTCVS